MTGATVKLASLTHTVPVQRDNQGLIFRSDTFNMDSETGSTIPYL